MTQLEIDNMTEETIQEVLFLYNNPEKWERVKDTELTQEENYDWSLNGLSALLDSLGIYFSNNKDENQATIKTLLDEAIASGQPGVAIERL